jgi:hypothetical protein
MSTTKTNFLTEVEQVIEAPLKAAAKTVVTVAIEDAWTVIGNKSGVATVITDVNAFATAVGSHFSGIGAMLVATFIGPIDTLLEGAATSLGSTATEATVTAYVLEHAGLE